MKSVKALIFGPLVAIIFFAASAAFTQEESFNSRELNFREYVTLLRADVRAQRKEIISQLMQFNDADAAKFWPIFQQYDAELTTIGDGRAQIIIDYARDYDSLTNEQADALMSKAFELEEQRARVKRKYFDKMKVALSATQAAKFFLIENQIQQIVDLQISASLPVVRTTSN